MRKELARVPIDEGVMFCVQKLEYEYAGLRDLNCQLIRTGELNPESRSEWLEKYKTGYVELHIAMDEVIAEIMPKYATAENKFYIDYRTCDLVAYQEIK